LDFIHSKGVGKWGETFEEYKSFGFLHGNKDIDIMGRSGFPLEAGND